MNETKFKTPEEMMPFIGDEEPVIEKNVTEEDWSRLDRLVTRQQD